jgi:hypothetical protein
MNSRPAAQFLARIAAKTIAAIEEQLRECELLRTIESAAENGKTSVFCSIKLTEDQIRWLESAGFMVFSNRDKESLRISWQHIFEIPIMPDFSEQSDASDTSLKNSDTRSESSSEI